MLPLVADSLTVSINLAIVYHYKVIMRWAILGKCVNHVQEITAASLYRLDFFVCHFDFFGLQPGQHCSRALLDYYPDLLVIRIVPTVGLGHNS